MALEKAVGRAKPSLFKEVEIATYMEKQQPSAHEHSRSEYFEVAN